MASTSCNEHRPLEVQALGVIANHLGHQAFRMRDRAVPAVGMIALVSGQEDLGHQPVEAAGDLRVQMRGPHHHAVRVGPGTRLRKTNRPCASPCVTP